MGEREKSFSFRTFAVRFLWNKRNNPAAPQTNATMEAGSPDVGTNHPDLNPKT